MGPGIRPITCNVNDLTLLFPLWALRGDSASSSDFFSSPPIPTAAAAVGHKSIRPHSPTWEAEEVGVRDEATPVGVSRVGAALTRETEPLDLVYMWHRIQFWEDTETEN